MGDTTTIKVNLSFNKYFDVNGNHTCAINWDTNEFCPFIITAKFGFKEYCFFEYFPSGFKDFGLLKRGCSSTGKESLGYLTPIDNCPFKNAALSSE